MSILAKQVRKRFLMEPDYLTLFPGDLSPDLASPGVRMPYMVTTASESVITYGINGQEEFATEILAFEIVAHTRAEADERAEWVRDKLANRSWGVVATDGRYTISSWRLDTMTEGVYPMVDGDDCGARTVTMTMTGTIRITPQQTQSLTGSKAVPRDTDKKIPHSLGA
jgi:hypothetical protein